MKQPVGLLLIALFSLQLGCASAPDPAVRLAFFMEDTMKEHRGDEGLVQGICQLSVPRGCVVVLHPDGDLTTAQLLAAGLSPSQVETVQGLRLGT